MEKNMPKKITRAQLLKGSQTLKVRLKKEMRDPKFARAFRAHALEAEIAQLVHDLRERRGLTQQKLADKIGIKQPALARIELGRQNITIGTLQAIAGAMGCEVKIQLIGVAR